MNIPFEKEVQALIEGWGFQDKKVRPPFVLCDIDAVYEELGTKPIAEEGFWQELDGKTYYLINSYGVKGTITGQPTGAVRWTDKQIPTEEIQKTIEILGVTEEDVIMYEDFLQRKAVEQMWETLEGAKKVAKETVVNFFTELSTQGFYSDCLGEIELYESADDRVKLLTGQALTAVVNQRKLEKDPDAEVPKLAWRKFGESKCYDWTNEQILKCAEDLQQTIQMGQLQMEDILEAIDDCTEIEQVKVILANVG